MGECVELASSTDDWIEFHKKEIEMANDNLKKYHEYIKHFKSVTREIHNINSQKIQEEEYDI